MIIALPEVKKVELGNKDKFILMGCDGVFETLNHAELLKFINDQIKEKEVTTELLSKTVENLLD